MKSKNQNGQNSTFIFRRNKTKTNNSVYNNYIINQDQDIISEKENETTQKI